MPTPSARGLRCRPWARTRWPLRSRGRYPCCRTAPSSGGPSSPFGKPPWLSPRPRLCPRGPLSVGVGVTSRGAHQTPASCSRVRLPTVPAARVANGKCFRLSHGPRPGTTPHPRPDLSCRLSTVSRTTHPSSPQQGVTARRLREGPWRLPHCAPWPASSRHVPGLPAATIVPHTPFLSGTLPAVTTVLWASSCCLAAGSRFAATGTPGLPGGTSEEGRMVRTSPGLRRSSPGPLATLPPAI